MNGDRIREITAEMVRLLDEQRALLKSASLLHFPVQETYAYRRRNERLRELCAQLKETTVKGSSSPQPSADPARR